MKKTEYDAIVIGGGQAGIPLAHALAGAKRKVALIERAQTRRKLCEFRLHTDQSGDCFGARRSFGAAVLANEGGELIHSYVDFMNADAPFTTLRDAVHIHPTLMEAVQSTVKTFSN